MATERAAAEQAVRSFLGRVKKKRTDVELDTSLFSEGIGLDSLETAELSAVLEDELGRDPFSQGATPQTIAEIVQFYGEDEIAPSA